VAGKLESGEAGALGAGVADASDPSARTMGRNVGMGASNVGVDVESGAGEDLTGADQPQMDARPISSISTKREDALFIA